MNIILTSIGKRIQLIEHLKTAFTVIGADASNENPAKHFVDIFYKIPRCKEEGYVEALLEIVEKEKVDAIIPLYEPEFAILNAARDRFKALDCVLVLSEQNVIEVCGNKKKTAAFFDKYNIPAPKTVEFKDVRPLNSVAGKTLLDCPYIVKPVDGMGSEGVFEATTMEELKFFKEYVRNPIIQECVSGTEYTIDVLCGASGRPIFIVPRVRIEVRAGEVSKSRTETETKFGKMIIEETAKLVKALNKEGKVFGPLTIQCFLSLMKDEVYFIEINPRFGGGVPLSFEAGADYAAALKLQIKLLKKGKIEEDLANTDYKEQTIKEMTMLRFDRAVYEETPYQV